MRALPEVLLELDGVHCVATRAVERLRSDVIGASDDVHAGRAAIERESLGGVDQRGADAATLKALSHEELRQLGVRRVLPDVRDETQGREPGGLRNLTPGLRPLPLRERTGGLG